MFHLFCRNGTGETCKGSVRLLLRLGLLTTVAWHLGKDSLHVHSERHDAVFGKECTLDMSAEAQV